MSRIFISYAREDSQSVALVERRLRRLDHEVWMDQRLKGGQAWWDEILLQIRECDVFLATVSPASIDSTACRREWAYAADLGRPILPVAIAEMTQALPKNLRQREVVDYANATEDAAFSLVAALNGLPQAPSLPDPLPEPPDVPLSYLASLLDSAESTSTLSRTDQLQMISELRPGLGAADKEERDGAFYVLGLLERREDLLAESDRSIRQLRAEYGHRAGASDDVEQAGMLLGASPGVGDGGEAFPRQEAAGQGSGAAPNAHSDSPIGHSEPAASDRSDPAAEYPLPTAPDYQDEPPVVGAGVPDGRPANNMVWGVLTTVFCCLPLGIVAIVNAARVNTLWANGDYEQAFKAAGAAGKWSAAAAAAGILVYAVYFAIFLSGDPYAY